MGIDFIIFLSLLREAAVPFYTLLANERAIQEKRQKPGRSRKSALPLPTIASCSSAIILRIIPGNSVID
jgi:hypothetical protein